MDPLLHPSNKKDPAVSKDAIGYTSWICQWWVIACHTPILPVGDNATNWLPIKNRYSTRTCKLKVPKKWIQRQTWNLSILFVQILRKFSQWSIRKITYIGTSAMLGYTPQTYLVTVRNGHHSGGRRITRAAILTNFRINGHPFDAALYVRRRKHQLPSGRVFQSVADDEMRVSYHDPVMVSFDNLHPQRISPIWSWVKQNKNISS